MNLAKTRLQNQGLLKNTFTSPEEVVRWFGAVQAQEYLASLWAIGLRLPANTTEDTVKQAILDRRIVRTWPMRGTIHYVPAEDAKWMTKLLARRVNTKFMPFLQRMGLTPEMLTTARDVLIKSLSGGEQLMRKDLYELFAKAGIADKSLGLHILGYWSQEGLLCFGPYEGKQQTFVLLDEWVNSSRELNEEEALAEITKRYFTSHGPATLHDFAWWAGLTIAEAKKGLSLTGQHFISKEYESKTYWQSKEADKDRLSSVLLLPCFDEYTVAYKDRSAAITSDQLKQVGYGINSNNIVIDGKIVGTWKRTLKKNDVVIQTAMLRTLTKDERQEFEVAALRYAQFIGLDLQLEN